MKVYLEPEEISKLEEAADNLRDRLLVRLLYFLASRMTSILAIATDDVDFKAGTIIIKHLKERVKLSCPHCRTRLSKSNRYCPGCSQKINQATREKLEETRRHILPIDTKTLKMLKEYIDRGGAVNRNGKLLIFGINRHRAWQIIKECAEKAGLPQLINPETGRVHGISPHRLRDAFAVHAVKTEWRSLQFRSQNQ